VKGEEVRDFDEFQAAIITQKIAMIEHNFCLREKRRE